MPLLTSDYPLCSVPSVRLPGPLHSLLTSPGNACDLQNYEPSLALNLEVADLINTKKGNA